MPGFEIPGVALQTTSVCSIKLVFAIAKLCLIFVVAGDHGGAAELLTRMAWRHGGTCGGGNNPRGHRCSFGSALEGAQHFSVGAPAAEAHHGQARRAGTGVSFVLREFR